MLLLGSLPRGMDSVIRITLPRFVGFVLCWLDCFYCPLVGIEWNVFLYHYPMCEKAGFFCSLEMKMGMGAV